MRYTLLFVLGLALGVLVGPPALLFLLVRLGVR
jgi:hypothetical protein